MLLMKLRRTSMLRLHSDQWTLIDLPLTYMTDSRRPVSSLVSLLVCVTDQLAGHGVLHVQGGAKTRLLATVGQEGDKHFTR